MFLLGPVVFQQAQIISLAFVGISRDASGQVESILQLE